MDTRNLSLLFIGALMLAFSVAGVSQSIAVKDLKRVARVTGKSLPDEKFPSPNETDKRFDIGGTDLGIGWLMGNGKMGFFFGDTYGKDWIITKEGGPGNAGNWRSNVLGISSDKSLEDGLTFDEMVSKEIIPSGKITDGTGSHTTIPTAAIHANGKEYVHYMEIRKWGNPGSWTTNYSSIYESSDAGMNWVRCPGVNFSAFSNFAQVAYAKKNGYIYMIGTRSGRWGGAYLARFKEKDILIQRNYQYWSRIKGWVTGNEHLANAIIKEPIGEMSLIYHAKYKRWIITYLNEKKAELVLRDAIELNGVWSEEKTLARGSEYPGLYGAFIHSLASTGDNLYFMMSMWHPYNVFLMRATIKFAE